MDDQASFNLLQNSETTAVFQLESRGMKDLIKRLQPDCLKISSHWWPCSVRVLCNQAW
ncbi:hypothetical protein O9992_04430 [Vibrio lentus]|nr:hypothetical protein [Vibrio lentus]